MIFYVSDSNKSFKPIDNRTHNIIVNIVYITLNVFEILLGSSMIRVQYKTSMLFNISIIIKKIIEWFVIFY